MLQLLRASNNEISVISSLAKTIWYQHYVSFIGKEQVDYMLGNFYNGASLLEQIEVKNHIFYLINYNSETLGFISVSSKNNINFHLHKFYINQFKARKGFGTDVLSKLINLINPKSITLNVNRQNYKSINFYFKNGFKITEIENIDIGSGYMMEDFVMEKVID